MSPTKIPLNFPVWKIITTMSTTADSNNHSEIIKVMNLQIKNFEAVTGSMNDPKHTKKLISGALGNSSDF